MNLDTVAILCKETWKLYQLYEDEVHDAAAFETAIKITMQLHKVLVQNYGMTAAEASSFLDEAR